MVQQENLYHYAIGRRKGAVAQVRLYETNGNITVNSKPIDEIFTVPEWVDFIKQPLNLINKSKKNSIDVKVNGGGFAGQSGAIRLAIARALIKQNPENRPALKDAGLLTRDSRIKESKKYGLVKARKAKQFSKR
jgi:small subunit ribosomal protein S9